VEQTDKPYVEDKSIGEAYVKALKFASRKKIYQYLTVHVSQPINSTSMKESPKSLEIEDWCKIINVGSIYEHFCRYPFTKKTGNGGNLGKDWINDRINALLSSEKPYSYHKRLEKQLEMVKKRLQMRYPGGKRIYGNSTNALICQVFQQTDLERACKPRPLAKFLPCLTMLDFKPKKDKLSLLAVFRSQFFDTKAYGNFISLAILLYKMCQKTGYEPGGLVSTANNLTFDNWKHHKDLYDYLLNPEKSKCPNKPAPTEHKKRGICG